jgi:flagellar biosynthesis repressor protein FlbT
MALKISLRPHERLIIGNAVIKNGSARSEFVMENNVPILREKDIMSIKDADSPCRRIYFAIQLMYVDEANLAQHHKTYWELVKDVVEAAPSTRELLNEISALILQRKYYQSLKETRKLIEYEQEVTNDARNAIAGL